MSELAIAEHIPSMRDVELADKEAENKLLLAQKFSSRIVDVVNQCKLVTKIGGRSHVGVDAWVLVAEWYGLRPKIEFTKRIDYEDGTWAFLSRASLIDTNGEVVSSAEMECGSDEPSWADKPKFQIRSMSETRAVGKVCRILLSPVMVLANFQPTPSEEMEGIIPASEPAPRRTRAAAPPEAEVVAETPPPVSPPQSAPQRSGGGSPYRQLMEYIEELGLDKDTLHRVAKATNGSGKITDYDDEQIQKTRIALDAAAGLVAPDEDADALPF